jgi:ABC-2 type transport system ATP-binding protein
VIEIRDLTKRFGNHPAVRNLDLTVQRGEFFAFLGPNGAGKTTTIKMITGLLRPTSGSVSVLGHDLMREPEEAKRLLGYIPDRPFLYEKLTGREYLSFVGELFRVSPPVVVERTERWLSAFELTECAEDFIESYSHGMRQKLVFAAALLHDPQIYVIDEPMVGLDPSSARLVKDVLREECLRGKTVFLSTHTLPVAEELADRIGIIHRGQLLACGTMEELRRTAAMDRSRLEEVFLTLTSEPQRPRSNVVRLGGSGS